MSSCSKVTLFGLILASIGLCNASYLVRMDVKTADKSGAQMTFGNVDVQIENIEGAKCYISELDSSGNNFQQGEIDVFEGGDLEGCKDFYAPFGTTSAVTLTHTGSDGWTCEYVRLVFDDGSTSYCPDGQEIDNHEVQTIYCTSEL